VSCCDAVISADAGKLGEREPLGGAKTHVSRRKQSGARAIVGFAMVDFRQNRAGQAGGFVEALLTLRCAAP